MVWKIGSRVYHGGDYYMLLQIPPIASNEEIIKSFRQLALKYHSDKTLGSPEMFMKLEEAKRILLDPELRRAYDGDRDTSSDSKLYCYFGSKSKTTINWMPSLKCGFQLSQALKNDLAKWRKMFSNLNPNRIDDNVDSSLLNAFDKYGAAVFDEMKKELESGHQYFCRICRRIFSSESEHYELMMAGYSDWIFDVDDKKNINSSDHDPIVFMTLRKKFCCSPSEPQPSSSPPNNNDFCWTEDMFKSQFQILNGFLDEKDFERADATCFGILTEIEKISIVKNEKLQESETSFYYLKQLIETRFKNDGYSALSVYRSLFQTYPDFMTHPLGEGIHEFIISKLFDGEKVSSSYSKCVGGLHFLLWNFDSDDSINTDAEFDSHMQKFNKNSEPFIDSIVNECFDNIDFKDLTNLLQICLTSNTSTLTECLRRRMSLFNIDMDTDLDYKNLRGEYKPMFLMIRGTICKLNGKYEEAQYQLASALDCCSDVNFQYRDVIPEGIARLLGDYELHVFIVSRLIQDRNEHSELFPDLDEFTKLRTLNIWNQQSTRSVIYKVAKLNEEKIQSRFSAKGYLETAFAILDFSQGLDLLSGKLLAFVHAIQYLLAELKIQSELQELFALKMAVEKYSTLIFYNANNFCPPDSKIYINRFVVATQVKLDLTLKRKIDEMKLLVGLETKSDDQKIPIVTEVSSQLLSESLARIFTMSKIFPFTTIPLLSVQDHVLSLPGSMSFLQHFIVSKSNISTYNTSRIFPPHIYAHEKLDAVWRGWGDEDILPNFELCRVEAMQQFLATRSWNLLDVEDILCWPMLRRTDEGWLNNEESSLWFPESETVYKTFAGFDLNMETGQIEFYMIPSDEENEGLFTLTDVADVLEGGISDAYFTLEDPDPQFRVHPFQEFSYYPPSLEGTDYLMTMLHADYLLKQITTGIEVNGLAPCFETRPSSDGFLQRYSPELEAILRPIMERVRDPIDSSECAHRFWIEAGKVNFNIMEGTGDWIKFDFISPEMMVKTKKLKKLPDGKLVDDLEATANTAEQQLADNMTKYYNEIGLKFPLLHRLKELTKISAMCDILKHRAHFFMEVRAGLQNRENVSKAADEFIEKRECNIRDSIIDFRSKLTSETPSPIYSEWRVEKEYQEVLAANNLQGQEHRIMSSEITRVKASIRLQLHTADQHRIQNCVDQLFAAFGLSTEPAMRINISNFLAGDGNATETIVVECQMIWRAKQLKQIETFLLGLQQGIDTSKSEFHGLTNDTEVCSWIPATFCNEFKPPVEYEFELLDERKEADPNQNQKPKRNINRNQKDKPEKLMSSLVNLAIDDKPAKIQPVHAPSTSELQPNTNIPSEDEIEEEEEEYTDPEVKPNGMKTERNRIKPSRVYGGINLSTVLEIASFIPMFRGVKVLNKVAKISRKTKRSRAGRKKRIMEIFKDPKTPSCHKGWIQQELNQIDRGKRTYIRLPNNTKKSTSTEMAHPRGKESAKGNDYSETYFQELGLHKLQHKYDKMGKLNKPK